MTNEKENELINLLKEKMCANCCKKNCSENFTTKTIFAPNGSKNYGHTYCIKCTEYTKETN